jgi:hypothetical protein
VRALLSGTSSSSEKTFRSTDTLASSYSLEVHSPSASVQGDAEAEPVFRTYWDYDAGAAEYPNDVSGGTLHAEPRRSRSPHWMTGLC